MKITLTGSLGHISRPLTEQLVAAGHTVTVISHNPKRADEIKALGAIPAIGSIADVAFLTRAFSGADAIYLMITAATEDADVFVAGKRQADTYVQAVQAADVKNIVNLSSVGANLGPEVGALHVYQIIEQTLTAGLMDANLTFIRPTGMYYNLFANLASIKAEHVIYTSGALDKPQSWVAPKDIVPIVFQALTEPQNGITSQYVASDEVSWQTIADTLGQAIGMPDLKAVQISDDQMLRGMLASGARPMFAEQMVKMYAYERDADFYADYRLHQPVLGPTKLTDFAKTFAQVYQR